MMNVSSYAFYEMITQRVKLIEAASLSHKIGALGIIHHPYLFPWSK